MPTNFADKQSFTDEEALDFHAGVKPGKLEIRASKPMATQKDLSLAPIRRASPYLFLRSRQTPIAPMTIRPGPTESW